MQAVEVSRLKEKILECKNNLANSKEEDLLGNFLLTHSLSTMLKGITGEVLFDYDWFETEHKEKEAGFIAEELEKKKNEVVLEQKKKFKSDFFYNPLITDPLNTLNNYFENLKASLPAEQQKYKLDYINRLLTKNKERKFSKEELSEIMTLFLEKTNPKYKDLYNELYENGQIIFIDKYKDFRATSGFNSGYYGKSNDYNFIVEPEVENHLYHVCNLAHEIGHTIEDIELREQNDYDTFLKYVLTSQFAECKSSIYEMKSLDFLEEIGYPKEEVENIRTHRMLVKRIPLKRMLTYIYSDKNNYLESFDDNLLNTNGFLLSMYMYNNPEKINIFDQEKLTSQGIEIYNKLDCDSQKINKSLVKYLKRCK